MEKIEFEKLNDFLAFLSLNGETEGVALTALRLQGELQKAEFEKNPLIWTLSLKSENQAYFSSFERALEGFKNFLGKNGKSASRNLKIRNFKYVGDLSFEELFENYSINLIY